MARLRRALLLLAVATLVVGSSVAVHRRGSHARSVATTAGTHVATASGASTSTSAPAPAVAVSSPMDSPQSGGSPPARGSDLTSAESTVPVTSDSDAPTTVTTLPPAPIAPDATTWPMPSPRSSVWGAVIDGLGRVWFADGNNSQVDMVRSDGSLDVHQLPYQVEGLARANDGGIWVATYSAGVAHFSATGAYTYIPVAQSWFDGTDYPRWVAETSDGSVWLSAQTHIIRLTPDGQVQLVTTGFWFGEIAVGGDGAVWTYMLNNDAGRLLRIALDGTITDRTPLGMSNRLLRLTPGLDGSVLFTFVRDGVTWIGRLDMSGNTTSWSLGASVDVATIADTAEGKVLWAADDVIGVAGGTQRATPGTVVTRLIEAGNADIWFTDFGSNHYGHFNEDQL